MAKVKANEVDRAVSHPNLLWRTFLIYGPDSGLVRERATSLAKTSGAPADDPFATIKLDADEAAADPARIADEAHTVGLFGGDRLIWITGTTQKNLARALQPILDTPPEGARVIVEAGDLKPTSPVRKAVEAASTAIALPCYADTTKALETLIDQEVSSSGLKIDPEARAALLSMLGADRMASRGEIRKLCIYAHGKEAITLDDVEAIVGDVSALAIDSAVDAASVGDVEQLEDTLSRLFEQETSTFQIVSSAQRQFQALHRLRSTMDERNGTPSGAVAGMKPPVHFKRKAVLERALTIWQSPALERVLGRFDKLALESRAQGDLASALIGTALLAVAVEATHAKRQRR